MDPKRSTAPDWNDEDRLRWIAVQVAAGIVGDDHQRAKASAKGEEIDQAMRRRLKGGLEPLEAFRATIDSLAR
jgi:hypothetical protein